MESFVIHHYLRASRLEGGMVESGWQLRTTLSPGSVCQCVFLLTYFSIKACVIFNWSIWLFIFKYSLCLECTFIENKYPGFIKCLCVNEFVEICLKRGKYWRFWSCSWPGPKRVCKSYILSLKHDTSGSRPTCHRAVTCLTMDHGCSFWGSHRAHFMQACLGQFPLSILSPLIQCFLLPLRCSGSLCCPQSPFVTVHSGLQCPLRSNSFKWVSFHWLS